jgi:hypothetical protein
VKKELPILLLGIIGLVFAAGLAWLFELRLEAGDVYPPDSSLRADPLGTMALYESLENLPGVVVRRDFSSDNRLPTEHSTTYLHLGSPEMELASISSDDFRELESFLARGGRLVIAFFPSMAEPAADEKAPADHSEPPPSAQPVPKKEPKSATTSHKRVRPPDDDDEDASDDFVPLWEKWGVDFSHATLTADGDVYQTESALRKAKLPLPAGLEWHSSLVFDQLDPAWRTIYARGTAPVVIERQFGAGSVVLLTDSFLLSNEALSKDRQPQFLSWLVGPSHQIVFDENHLGILETSGVAALIRQFRLEGFVAGLALLAGLFVWRNSFSLVPPPVRIPVAAQIAGKDTLGGFINMLGRHIPLRDVLGHCHAEWKKSHARTLPAAKVDQVQALVDEERRRPPRQRDPLSAYRKIVAVLKRPVLSKSI